MNQMDSDFNQQNILNFAHQSNSPVSDEYSSSRSNSIVNDNSGSATPFYTVINVAKQLVCSLFWFGMYHRHCLYLELFTISDFFLLDPYLVDAGLNISGEIWSGQKAKTGGSGLLLSEVELSEAYRVEQNLGVKEGRRGSWIYSHWLITKSQK